MPPEFQMLMLVSTTAYICNCKNKRKGEIEAYLNQQIISPKNDAENKNLM